MLLTKSEFVELTAKAGAGTLTDEEAAILEPHRVRNAIILAAGICSRCAPISYDYPKALVEVRGERLIDRQIRQLLTAGITDITVVVGHMKEKFEYLREKYGVSFVEAPLYAVTNNIVSLAQAADRIGNTYILLSDQFFTVNPFERYVYRSYYATTLKTSGDDWVMETNPEGVVVDMITDADSGEKLQGPCYVDAETGAALVKAIEDTIADGKNTDQYWEYAWYLNSDKMSIVTRYYPQGVVNHFKTMDDLMAFDDSYLLHVDSQALRNICGVLECKPEDIHGCANLPGGQTNYACSFYVGDERYAYRHPVGYLAPVSSSREIEAIAEGYARDCGVDPTFIYEDPETGWKIAHFIKGAKPIDETSYDDVYEAVGLIRRFQEATKGVVVDSTYDSWSYAQNFEKNIAAHNLEIDDRSITYRDRMYKLYGYFAQDEVTMALCNNDTWYANFLRDEDGTMHFIDWEFAAMSDYMTDVAKLSQAYCIGIPPEDRDFHRNCLRLFLGRDYTFEEWRHYMALVMIRNWWVCVYVDNFFAISEMASDWPIDSWLGVCWALFDKQLDYSLSLYEGVVDL